MPRKIHLLPPEYRSTVRQYTAEDRHAALCRELEYLRSEVKRLESLIRFKDLTLLRTAGFFEEILRDNTPQSIEGLKRRISQLKGAVDREQGGLPE